MLRFENTAFPVASLTADVVPDRVPPEGLFPMAIVTVTPGTTAPVVSVILTNTEGVIGAPAAVGAGCWVMEMSPVFANTVSGRTVAGVVCGGNDESVACTWTLNTPEVVATPVIEPLALGVSPVGSPATLHVVGGIPPREDRKLL